MEIHRLWFWILDPFSSFFTSLILSTFYRIEHVRYRVPYFNFFRTEELNRTEEIRRVSIVYTLYSLLTVFQVAVHLNNNLLQQLVINPQFPYSLLILNE